MAEEKTPPSDAHLEVLGLHRWQHRSDAQNSDTEDPGQRGNGSEVVSGGGNGQSENTLTLEPEKVHQHKWRRLRKNVSECTRCELYRTRKNTVFGVGKEDADLLLIGEAPGADEDAQGEPFVGRAGLLLNNMLSAIGMQREEVFIANILKCRPPGNENPTPEQAYECRGHLQGQIELIQPRVILALGSVAAQNLLEVDTPIGRLRGQVHSLPGTEIPVIPSYHPAYLLRSPKKKADAFQDLLLLLDVMARGSATPS